MHKLNKYQQGLLEKYGEGALPTSSTRDECFDFYELLRGLLQLGEVEQAREFSSRLIQAGCHGVLMVWWHVYEDVCHRDEYSGYAKAMRSIKKTEALRYVELIAEQFDDPMYDHACFELALERFYARDTVGFCQWIERAVDKDHYTALILYGYCLQGHYGVKKDTEQSALCFKRARDHRKRCEAQGIICASEEISLELEGYLPEKLVDTWYN